MQRHRPPGPRGEPLFGNSRRYARDPFSFLEECAAGYGDVVRFDLGPLPTYMLTNPADIERVLVGDAATYHKLRFGDAVTDLLGEGLLMSEGADWQRQRRLANPAFRAERVAGLDLMMVDHAREHVADWRGGDRVDLNVEVARLTVRIIIDAMFGASADADTVRAVQENLEPLGARFEPDPRRVLVPDWVPTRENREFRRAVDTLEGIIDDIVAERISAGRQTQSDDVAERRGTETDPQRMDLLSILLRAQARGEQTDRHLRDELMTMLLAGHDTTALLLTYTWYLLSKHPEAERRVLAELDEAFGDGPPTAAAARELTYTDRVLHEAMRLYPPVYALFREPQVDVKLGGYRVPAESAVMLPQWVVHRSPRWWDDPETFDPDRFSPERSAGRPRFAYFPFGGGPRICVGKQFSLLEAKLILGVVARRFRLEYVGTEPFDLRGSLTMHPRNPVTMELRER